MLKYVKVHNTLDIPLDFKLTYECAYIKSSENSDSSESITSESKSSGSNIIIKNKTNKREKSFYIFRFL